MFAFRAPTTAKEIVKHIQDGGRCIVKVIPHGHVTFTVPREVEQIRMDGNGEWWFGVQLFAFQWFQFPAVGLEWRLIEERPTAVAGIDSANRAIAQWPTWKRRALFEAFGLNVDEYPTANEQRAFSL
jgi:hypothetical protein